MPRRFKPPWSAERIASASASARALFCYASSVTILSASLGFATRLVRLDTRVLLRGFAAGVGALTPGTDFHRECCSSSHPRPPTTGWLGPALCCPRNPTDVLGRLLGTPLSALGYQISQPPVASLCSSGWLGPVLPVPRWRWAAQTIPDGGLRRLIAGGYVVKKAVCYASVNGPSAATIEEFAAEGFTHIECHCPRCRMTRLRPISWLPRISMGLTIAQLSARLHCAEYAGRWLRLARPFPVVIFPSPERDRLRAHPR